MKRDLLLILCGVFIGALAGAYFAGRDPSTDALPGGLRESVPRSASEDDAAETAKRSLADPARATVVAPEDSGDADGESDRVEPESDEPLSVTDRIAQLDWETHLVLFRSLATQRGLQDDRIDRNAELLAAMSKIMSEVAPILKELDLDKIGDLWRVPEARVGILLTAAPSLKDLQPLLLEEGHYLAGQGLVGDTEFLSRLVEEVQGAALPAEEREAGLDAIQTMMLLSGDEFRMGNTLTMDLNQAAGYYRQAWRGMLNAKPQGPEANRLFHEWAENASAIVSRFRATHGEELMSSALGNVADYMSADALQLRLTMRREFAELQERVDAELRQLLPAEERDAASSRPLKLFFPSSDRFLVKD